MFSPFSSYARFGYYIRVQSGHLSYIFLFSLFCFDLHPEGEIFIYEQRNVDK